MAVAVAPFRVGCLVAALGLIPGHGGGRITTTPTPPVAPPGIQAVTTLPPISGGLTDVAVSDGSLWVPGNGVVQRIDAATGSLQRQIPVKGASDYRYVAIGAGGVWVTDSGTQEVTRIDPSTDRVVAVITLNETPERAVTFVGGRVWVAYTSSAGNGVVVIDPRTNRAGPPIPFSRLGTSMVTGDHHLWMSDGSVVTHDTGQHLTASVRLPRSYRGLQLVAAGDRALWFIGPSRTSGVTRLDTATINPPTSSRVARRIPIPGAVEVAVTENAIWVLTNRNDQTTDHPGQLWELDPNSLKTVGSPITVGWAPVRLLATASDVWVANYGDSTITSIALRPRTVT